MFTKIKSLFARLGRPLLIRLAKAFPSTALETVQPDPTWLLERLKSHFSSQNQKIFKKRKDAVRQFLHVDLPGLFPKKFTGKLIVEDGKYNYFLLPSGDLPLIDFVVPEIPLFVCVGDPTTSSWDHAQQMGISDEEWEKGQADMACIKDELPLIAVETTPSPIYHIYVEWNDPVDPYSLIARIKETIGNALDN